MLENGFVNVKRNEDNSIVEYESNFEEISENEIYIRYGQLNDAKKLEGIGRKITLKPKYYAKKVVDFSP